MFSNKIIVYVNVFCARMRDRIVSEYNIFLVVSMDNYGCYLWKVKY